MHHSSAKSFSSPHGLWAGVWVPGRTNGAGGLGVRAACWEEAIVLSILEAAFVGGGGSTLLIKSSWWWPWAAPGGRGKRYVCLDTINISDQCLPYSYLLRRKLA